MRDQVRIRNCASGDSATFAVNDKIAITNWLRDDFHKATGNPRIGLKEAKDFVEAQLEQFADSGYAYSRICEFAKYEFEEVCPEEEGSAEEYDGEYADADGAPIKRNNCSDAWDEYCQSYASGIAARKRADQLFDAICYLEHKQFADLYHPTYVVLNKALHDANCNAQYYENCGIAKFSKAVWDYYGNNCSLYWNCDNSVCEVASPDYQETYVVPTDESESA